MHNVHCSTSDSIYYVSLSQRIIIIVWQPFLLLLAPQHIRVSSHKVLHIHLAADSHHCPIPPTPNTPPK